MLFRQVINEDLRCASYLVGDTGAGVAAVVDPQHEVDVYLDLARHAGVRIAHVLETHNHADHVSGHGRLASATGATLHVHRLADAQYPHEPLADGDELVLGDLVIRALHTPGHRPEHTAFVLADRGRGDAPWALLSGDSLFVGDVARPDLAVDARDGARALHASLQGLRALPDHVEVWPGHLGGSECGGAGMDLKTSSTLGFERGHNPLLAVDDVDAFTDRVTTGLGDKPPSVERIVARNVGPLRDAPATSRPLTPHELVRHQAAGALVVDVRPDADFDAAHVPGSVCDPVLRPGFGSKLGWLAATAHGVVFVAADDATARHAARLAAAAGVDAVHGHLGGGWPAWRADVRAVDSVERVAADDLPGRLDDEPDLQLLDVRSAGEWEATPLREAIHAPWNTLDSLPDGLDPTAPVAVLCASGQRATTAAGLLRRAGVARVLHVVGGGAGTLRDASGRFAPA